MTQLSETSPNLEQKLAELKETQENEKVELTPEVERYHQEHVEAIQEKLAKGEEILESDLKFIKYIRRWILMPEFWQKKNPGINEFVISELTSGVGYKEQEEAKKRDIFPKQWMALLHMAEAAGWEIQSIDQIFEMWNGRIEAERLTIERCPKLKYLPEGLSVIELSLDGCTGISALPDDIDIDHGLSLDGCTQLSSIPSYLYVKGYLSLSSCDSLSSLPESLNVGNLNLSNCKNIRSLPDKIKIRGSLLLSGCYQLESLPKNLKVRGELDLRGCKMLSTLPEGLEVGDAITLFYCTGLKTLPMDLKAKRLSLSKNVDARVKKDAEKLKKKGAVKKLSFI